MMKNRKATPQNGACVENFFCPCGHEGFRLSKHCNVMTLLLVTVLDSGWGDIIICHGIVNMHWFYSGKELQR